MQRAWWGLLGLFLIACGDDLTVEETCRDYCGCTQSLPSLQRECRRSCEASLADEQPSPECLACISRVACDESSDACDRACAE